MSDDETAPTWLPLIDQRDWNDGEFGPVVRCSECWKMHPLGWDCQARPIEPPEEVQP